MEEITVDSRVEHWKSQLVDLSLRNGLLNFQGSGPGSIRFLRPGSQEIFDYLVKRGRELVIFQSVLDSKQDKIVDGPADIVLKKGDILPSIQGEALTRSLVRLKVKARSALKEQGFNILFISFGLLLWKDKLGEELRSPLIMVPVELKRDTCFDPYRIIMTDEVLINPTLTRKVQLDYNAVLPPLPDNLNSFELASFFDVLKKVPQETDQWDVEDGVYLNLFSFTKSGMYNDLETAAELARSHPIIRALSGDHSDLNNEPAGEVALDSIPCEEVFQILDADSSQQQAIEAAKRGESFVLQGPPGTGKSQTISNIISESIAARKTVLFVSEKMAALEVVKRRLNECHLGDYCLELHSHKANKSTVLGELSRAMEPVPSPSMSECDFRWLNSLRSQLNDYAASLHKPRGKTGWTGFEIHGRLAELRDAKDLSFDLPEVMALDDERFRNLSSTLQRVSDSYSKLLTVEDNPWSQSTICSWDFGTKGEVESRLESFMESLDSCVSYMNEASSECELPNPRNITEAHQVLQLMRTISETPYPLESWLDPKRIDILIVRAEEARVAHADHQQRLDWLFSIYDKKIMDLDTHSMMERMTKKSGGMKRLLDREYSKDRNALGELRLQPEKLKYEEILTDLKDINEIKETGIRLKESDEGFLSSYGVFYEGMETDWSRLSLSLEWSKRFIENHEIKEGCRLVKIVCHDEEYVDHLKTRIIEMTESLGHLESRVRSLSDYFKIRSMPPSNSNIKEVNFDELRVWSRSLLDKIDLLQEWVELNGLMSDVEKMGLQAFLEEAKRAHIPPESIQKVFLKQLYVRWLDAVYCSDPILKSFTSEKQEDAIREFRKLDKIQLEIAGKRMARRMNDRRREVLESSTDDKKSESFTLKREIAKKRSQKTLRQLFSEIPTLLLTLKPCLLMSPLSISQFLDPTVFKFDLVIFDEASQIRPEDAVGAIMRGRQVIVVGDSKQLPPTAFFTVIEDETESVEELDSILDECTTIGIPQRSLKWHYRSRYESLIAFSNFHFYGNRLSTFPSARDTSDGAGIEFIHVPDGIYDRGKTRKNIQEATRVAELVFQHFSEYPERSLGVVAFSEAQQMAILDELERLRKTMPDFEPYFDEEKEEEFFVKNLESVQGDERDVMFFSVGYGRDPDGEISMNFGPLNSLGGQRRLNVAITRARTGVKLISSIRPEDLGISESQSQGVRLLREYMEYARSGGKKEVLFTEETEGGAIQESICQALRARGLEVHQNLGCSEYRIDIAVQDPRQAGHYILGIECDGKVYCSAKTARDRERLRQETLEKLGWRMHRVWSRDWVERPEREAEKIIELVEEEKIGYEVGSDEAIFSNNEENIMEGGSDDTLSLAEAIPVEATSSLGVRASLRTYRRAGREDLADLIKKHSTNPASVEREAVARIVSLEGPVHRVAVMKRLSEFFGQLKRGKSKDSTSRGWAAIEDASKRGLITIKGEFLWPPQMELPKVRCNPPEGPSRDISEIPPEEMELAILRSISNSTLKVDTVVWRTAKMLGLDPESLRVRSRINSIIISLVEARKLDYGERNVSLAENS